MRVNFARSSQLNLTLFSSSVYSAWNVWLPIPWFLLSLSTTPRSLSMTSRNPRSGKTARDSFVHERMKAYWMPLNNSTQSSVSSKTLVWKNTGWRFFPNGRYGFLTEAYIPFLTERPSNKSPMTAMERFVRQSGSQGYAPLWTDTYQWGMVVWGNYVRPMSYRWRKKSIPITQNRESVLAYWLVNPDVERLPLHRPGQPHWTRPRLKFPSVVSPRWRPCIFTGKLHPDSGWNSVSGEMVFLITYSVRSNDIPWKNRWKCLQIICRMALPLHKFQLSWRISTEHMSVAFFRHSPSFTQFFSSA